MIKTVYILCNDLGYEGIQIVGVYDDINKAKHAAVMEHINCKYTTISTVSPYIIEEAMLNGGLGESVEFKVDADAIIAYGISYDHT